MTNSKDGNTNDQTFLVSQRAKEHFMGLFANLDEFKQFIHDLEQMISEMVICGKSRREADPSQGLDHVIVQMASFAKFFNNNAEIVNEIVRCLMISYTSEEEIKKWHQANRL